jgi:hypothetical protein
MIWYPLICYINCFQKIKGFFFFFIKKQKYHRKKGTQLLYIDSHMYCPYHYKDKFILLTLIIHYFDTMVSQYSRGNNNIYRDFVYHHPFYVYIYIYRSTWTCTKRIEFIKRGNTIDQLKFTIDPNGNKRQHPSDTLP